MRPLELGITSLLLAPEGFTTNPYRWLKLISEQPATFSGSPNFGYELCMRKVTEKQRRSLDLSSWVLAINSGEPVRWLRNRGNFLLVRTSRSSGWVEKRQLSFLCERAK